MVTMDKFQKIICISQTVLPYNNTLCILLQIDNKHERPNAKLNLNIYFCLEVIMA